MRLVAFLNIGSVLTEKISPYSLTHSVNLAHLSLILEPKERRPTCSADMSSGKYAHCPLRQHQSVMEFWQLVPN